MNIFHNSEAPASFFYAIFHDSPQKSRGTQFPGSFTFSALRFIFPAKEDVNVPFLSPNKKGTERNRLKGALSAALPRSKPLP